VRHDQRPCRFPRTHSRQPPAASRQPPAASRQPPAASRQPPAPSSPVQFEAGTGQGLPPHPGAASACCARRLLLRPHIVCTHTDLSVFHGPRYHGGVVNDGHCSLLCSHHAVEVPAAGKQGKAQCRAHTHHPQPVSPEAPMRLFLRAEVHCRPVHGLTSVLAAARHVEERQCGRKWSW
jgi:hypothetical protein